MRDFLDDIFGKKVSSHFEAGLVDAKSESALRAALVGLKGRWNNLERSCSRGNLTLSSILGFTSSKQTTYQECPSILYVASVSRREGLAP